MSENRRVVVTGIGAITPLGNSVSDTWENMNNGKNGIGRFCGCISFTVLVASRWAACNYGVSLTGPKARPEFGKAKPQNILVHSGFMV